MATAAASGHAISTALAERLVARGVPFRDAHWPIGELVAQAEARGCDVSQLPESELREALPELVDETHLIPTLSEAIGAADLPGGTAPARVREALNAVKERLA